MPLCFSQSQTHLQSRNDEDTVSTASSVYGSEEKTIKAVCEQMKVSYWQFLWHFLLIYTHAVVLAGTKTKFYGSLGQVLELLQLGNFCL